MPSVGFYFAVAVNSSRVVGDGTPRGTGNPSKWRHSVPNLSRESLPRSRGGDVWTNALYPTAALAGNCDYGLPRSNSLSRIRRINSAVEMPLALASFSKAAFCGFER